ncbi:uncharacterized protein N7484_000421 [Penicillium longicatenatum]|uniref:uncharacterized protein n=1 Tax=Penicillium longicatenatum TaxID=1561947 RepID=UPI00254924EE|nr:uncharacterized protein N7484_000421 [Penicillium longicatenatum]KAJ5661049.1 hypothetical protein N7484_000421 [Penicillium longicatenatum]KAJ5667292.1 hypothetical protein N7507_003156 [Penicillium longicatenatum]
MGWNVFRYLADISHLASICILIWAIHRNKSAEGVSLLTQGLYAVVFVARYLDILKPSSWAFSHGASLWNILFKLFYLSSSFYLVFIMMKVFPRTRETERAWKLGIYSVAGSLVLAPIAIAILEGGFPPPWFLELCWSFSIILESVCVLPQLLLLRQTTVPTVIDSYYLGALGSYRAFYILNWLVRGFGNPPSWDPIALVFGLVQTAFYVDFAWVYYSRQRVKLRNGGVVDSEDLRKSWLVNRVLNLRGVRGSSDEEQGLREDAEGDENRGSNNRWGARGVSIAADDTLDHHQTHGNIQNPDDFEGVLGDDGSDEDDHDLSSSRHQTTA